MYPDIFLTSILCQSTSHSIEVKKYIYIYIYIIREAHIPIFVCKCIFFFETGTNIINLEN